MADPFEVVFGPLGVVRDRIVEVLNAHGLAAVYVAFAPAGGTEGPHEVQILARIDDGPDPSARDEEFERVVKDARDAEVDARAEAALHELQQRLRTSGGFLD